MIYTLTEAETMQLLNEEAISPRQMKLFPWHLAHDAGGVYITVYAIQGKHSRREFVRRIRQCTGHEAGKRVSIIIESIAIPKRIGIEFPSSLMVMTYSDGYPLVFPTAIQERIAKRQLCRQSRRLAWHSRSSQDLRSCLSQHYLLEIEICDVQIPVASY